MKFLLTTTMALGVVSLLTGPTSVQARGGGRGHMEAHPQETMRTHPQEDMSSHQSMESHPNPNRQSDINRNLENRNLENEAGWTGEGADWTGDGTGCFTDSAGNLINCN
ncbi:MAG TPA: hypothetical protein VMW10_10270 [Alphaproteobacteria bacterium]|nr:hypothetical protein [Alphaproteobacteria bacterium]